MTEVNVELSVLQKFSDLGSLKKLASALWQEDVAFRGAAVMVGAGFSRCGARSGDAAKRLPLWSHVAEAIAKELGVAGGSSEPTRLAAEYSSYFGQRALIDLIEREICDSSWEPGEIFNRLLSLPWTEVLTTNWDTLLERASQDVHSPIYSVVSRQEDLASARSPRIVKLHGTVGITESLTFTQEDYRRYPQEHAAFVNFARHVFIENELCLLGFSGDDPNFLQWAGWVRDHLASRARKIYLVGALNLSRSRRKFLESINVAPIDLSELLSEYDGDSIYEAANELFLAALLALKPRLPSHWRPTKIGRTQFTEEEHRRTTSDPAYAAALLASQLSTLQKDRESYPGWIVCPIHQRWELQNQIGDPYPTKKNVQALEEGERVRLLYEMAWRFDVTFQVVPDWITELLLEACRLDGTSALNRTQKAEVAHILLKNTRWQTPENAQRVAAASRRVLEAAEKSWPDAVNELAYHDAILARDSFHYEDLERYVSKIEVTNPVWGLRKAALVYELGRVEESERLASEALRELVVQNHKDPRSLYVFSRLAWAHWIYRGMQLRQAMKPLESFPVAYSEQKCSPWDQIQHIQDEVEKELHRQREEQEIEPSFEPGSYRDKSRTIRFSNKVDSILEIEGITRATGLPLQWEGVGFLSDAAGKAAEGEDVPLDHALALVIRASTTESNKSLERVLLRSKIAAWDQRFAESKIEQFTRAVQYWAEAARGAERRRYAIERLRVLMEVLARISVRATPGQAKALFMLATELATRRELQHFWLTEPLRHMAEYCLESIPPSEQSTVLLTALSYPLPQEIAMEDRNRWPNPVVENPGQRGEDPAVDVRINELISAVKPCNNSSAAPLLRLLPLYRSKFLTDGESEKLGQSLWDECAQDKMPSTGLYPHVLLSLPGPDPLRTERLVRKYLFEASEETLLDKEFLADLASSGRSDEHELLPTSAEAVTYFDRLVAWKPKERSVYFAPFEHDEIALARRIGDVLTRVVAPAMSADAMTDDRFGQISAFVRQRFASTALGAIACFGAAKEHLSATAEARIRQALRSADPHEIQGASYAVLCWRRIVASPASERLSKNFISAVGIGEPFAQAGTLSIAVRMLNEGYFSQDELDALAEIVPAVFSSMEYARIPASSKVAVTASVVRASCVSLASGLLTVIANSEPLKRVLEEARKDALPEVRFAAMQAQ